MKVTRPAWLMNVPAPAVWASAIVALIVLVVVPTAILVNLGGGDDKNASAEDSAAGSSSEIVSTEVCSENIDPSVDARAFVVSGADCFQARRINADGVWLSRTVAGAQSSTEARTWQINQTAQGDAAIQEVATNSVPIVVAGGRDYVPAASHPAFEWLVEEHPEVEWVTYPSVDQAWLAGKLDEIVALLAPEVEEWTGSANPNGGGIATGYLKSSSIRELEELLGSPLSITVTRDADGTLDSLMISGGKSVHTWRVLSFRKTLLPPLADSETLPGSEIPRGAGGVAGQPLGLLEVVTAEEGEADDSMAAEAIRDRRS